MVIARSGENWRVDIGAAHMANLDGLAFEGATKRNRPNLKVGLHRAPWEALLRIVAGWFASVCTRLARAQRHGAGAGMLRRADTQGRGLRRAERRIRGALQPQDVSTVSSEGSLLSSAPLTPSQIARSKTLSPTNARLALSSGGSNGLQWARVGQFEGGETHHRCLKMYRGCGPRRWWNG